MSNASETAVTPRPAATVVILRDGREGLEAFMVVRHHEIDFASGALVFPGGKVDPHDADPAWDLLAPYAAPAPDRAFVVAAARETFEEAGLVLARRRGTQAMLDAADAHRLVETYRAGLLAGSTTFLDLVRSEDLLLATDLMVPFAHWITPAGRAQALRHAFSPGSGADESARRARRLRVRSRGYGSRRGRPCARPRPAHAPWCSPPR